LIAPARRGSRSYADRLRTALDLLRNPVFDALLNGESPFEQLPETMRRIADGEIPMCHLITYGD